MGEKSRPGWQIPFCVESCECKVCREKRRRKERRLRRESIKKTQRD